MKIEDNDEVRRLSQIVTYRCAHGKAMEEYCPGKLFWNAGMIEERFFYINVSLI